VVYLKKRLDIGLVILSWKSVVFCCILLTVERNKMKWSQILPAVVAFLTAFLLPFIFSKRKKDHEKKIKNYSQNLRDVGIDFETIGKDDPRVHFIKKLSWGHKAEGIFALKGKNIDYIFLISVTSQYGVNYFLEYIVLTTFTPRDESIKNTVMKVKRDSLMRGGGIDVFWKGDRYLSQKLNMDYELKYKVLHSGLKECKITLKIVPEKKHGYTRIKTNFMVPSQELISFIDSIAGHVKAGL